MTDDNALPHGRVGDDEPLPEQAPASPDDTPAETAPEVGEADSSSTGLRATTEDHSPWMRPAEGETRPRRALEAELDVAPTGDEAIHEPGIVETDSHEGASAEPQLPVHAPASLAGARAAMARADAPGASLEGPPTPTNETGDGSPEPTPSSLRGLWPWLAAALALGLVSFGLLFHYTGKSVVVVTESPTPSASPTPTITHDDLMSVTDANLMAKQAWTAGEVLDKIEPTSPQPACVVSNPGQPNAILTHQRTLTSSGQKAIESLHQIDAYASVADARKVFQMRVGNITSCAGIPALLVRADQITGIGDEAVSNTIAYQDKSATTYHTLLIVRTGTSVHMFDAARADSPIPVAELLKAASGPVSRQCGRAEGKCLNKPTSTEILPQPAGDPGWLLAADLPRIVPGQGMWRMTDTKALDTQGSMCEQMDLNTVEGPTQREQRTYVMTQDPSAPQTFGIDEVVFTMKDDKAATTFATTLRNNIKGCQKQSETAKVSEATPLKGGAPGGSATGESFLVTQSLGNKQTALFRVGVMSVGNKVIYLLNNPSKSYDPGSEGFGKITVRAMQRAAQAT